MKWIGAGYLIYLGVTGLRSTIRGNSKMTLSETGTSSFDLRKSLREGFLSNVLNPKTAVFYLAFLPQFIDPQYSPFLQSILMATIHFSIAMLWQCGLASAINFAKKLVQNGSVMSWMEGFTGVALIGLGIKLLMEEPPTATS
jgi:threonine/homoserine/homoserine lactone efflux protein